MSESPIIKLTRQLSELRKSQLQLQNLILRVLDHLDGNSKENSREKETIVHQHALPTCPAGAR
ncbi:MAG: hypothetical protein PVG60_01860 [Desulfarculaceae bacterium]|jgi:hypothetical protein